MEDQGTVTVKFPRKTDTKSGWTIDSSFIARVRHSIPPDEDEWIPGHEEVQAVLLALECIPAGIFTQPKQDQGEPVAWESVLGAVARGWCYEENANKTMDSELALAIAKEVSALYTTPQQRKPLSDEQIEAIADEYLVDYRIPAGCAWYFARDIEAAHGIKE
jgi:hypothetical protein